MLEGCIIVVTSSRSINCYAEMFTKDEHLIPSATAIYLVLVAILFSNLETIDDGPLYCKGVKPAYHRREGPSEPVSCPSAGHTEL